MLPKPSDSRRANGQPQECPPDTKRSRAEGSCSGGGGLTKTAAASPFNTTPKTVTKWVERFNAEAWIAPLETPFIAPRQGQSPQAKHYLGQHRRPAAYRGESC